MAHTTGKTSTQALRRQPTGKRLLLYNRLCFVKILQPNEPCNNNSILIYLCANSTAQGPITKLARVDESK
jgi:hypothetical protein